MKYWQQLLLLSLLLHFSFSTKIKLKLKQKLKSKLKVKHSNPSNNNNNTFKMFTDMLNRENSKKIEQEGGIYDETGVDGLDGPDK